MRIWRLFASVFPLRCCNTGAGFFVLLIHAHFPPPRFVYAPRIQAPFFGGTLDVSYTKIATFPDDLHVCGDLWMGGVDIPLPDDITVLGEIHTENYMD